ncbi:hypothetical protein AAG584_24935, partial [Vreelandella titanicae]
DSDGDFHQLYTQPGRQAFFFELVQREGYQGLGAPNAFVRVTAQQRLEAEIDGIAQETPNHDSEESQT